MKSRKNQNLAIATIGAWWLSKVVAPTKAFHYCRAAQRDEHNGFPYTAAIEWRKAAELFARYEVLADHAWREWERIMKLPRRLAEPICVTPQSSVPKTAVATMQFSMAPVNSEVSFAHAA